MPSQRIPATPVGGITSRRHAKLLLHLVESDGGGGTRAPVKDLRLRRVTPPASAPLDTSPDCVAAKPGSIDCTPPEAASVAEAVEDRERKQMLPRSKLVRDPGSFGYRRLLPFLNLMAKNGASDNSNGKDMPPENVAANSKKELNVSNFGLVGESVNVSGSGADHMDSVESPVVKAKGDQEMKDCSDSVKEDTNIVPADLSSSKPWLARCSRSKFVHHPSSFNYKRMLPFLMENEISSQEDDRVKFRRVHEDLTSNDDNGLATEQQHHIAVLEGSPDECNRAERTSKSDGIDVLDGGQLQSAVAEVSLLNGSPASKLDGNCLLKGGQLKSTAAGASPLDGSTAEVQTVTQEEVSISNGNDVLASGQCQPVISENSPDSNRAEVARAVEELKSDENSVLNGVQLQPTVPEASPQKGVTAEMQKAAEEHALTSDGDQVSKSTSDKGELLAKKKPQLCDEEELLKQDAELPEVRPCQISESGCSVVGFGSPTEAAIPLVNRLLEAGMICRTFDPCAIGTPSSVQELSGPVMQVESGSTKLMALRPCGAPCLKKQGLSPKKLSPKKGILKRTTRGCKGLCMCLDCSVFRLRADRAFEFSRKQMQEADDIIGNLLEEMASLRSLTEKSSGQQEQVQAACQRALQVEEVTRERRQHMLMELNSHCKIPGPRVKFAQYIEEKMASSPSTRSKW